MHPAVLLLSSKQLQQPMQVQVTQDCVVHCLSLPYLHLPGIQSMAQHTAITSMLQLHPCPIQLQQQRQSHLRSLQQGCIMCLLPAQPRCLPTLHLLCQMHNIRATLRDLSPLLYLSAEFVPEGASWRSHGQ